LFRVRDSSEEDVTKEAREEVLVATEHALVDYTLV